MSIDFSTFLPDQDPIEINKAKEEAPISFLYKYAESVNYKYKPKIKAIVTEKREIAMDSLGLAMLSSNDIELNLVYSLFFEASVGNGYLYKLLEVVELTPNFYPVKVTIFENYPSELGVYFTHEQFINAISVFLQSPVVKMIILNLLARVDLYDENRQDM